ncbi:unnamed protein product [Acanthoscelides obtectus]|uniref:Uncharacterized protein n=1 Tax=Acanthoscelides obtectus TaxID=200917 RepID=A0A9P0KX72_ACAOB|nr:unnamed protein product [Acanthoscelides obtectus]CAK1675757.1 hypothetical protein AOBTE_LOCUS30414 [Acanthoscelides obtectus]
MAMANSDWENRRPLTQRELQNEVDNVWQNEDEADSDEDLFGELSDRDNSLILTMNRVMMVMKLCYRILVYRAGTLLV